MDNRISALAVDDYDVVRLMAAVERHFALLDLWADLRPGMRVTLKPNLLAKHRPDRAVTTHPAVVEAVTRVLQAHGIADITLADSPGGPYTRPLLQSVYAGCGMTEVAQRTGLRLNLDTGWRECTAPEAGLCREFNIIAPVAEADLVINLCKLKTHAMVTYSGAVKNLFGCVPGLQKPELHFRFPEKDTFCRMLVDLAQLVRPGITLVDAVVAMEGNGPSAGEPRHMGQTFAARNPHTLDLALCDLIGLPPEAVLTVAHAVAGGLCPDDAAAVLWLGDGRPGKAARFRHPDSKPLSFGGHIPAALRGPLEWVETKFLTPRPVVFHKDCIGCGKCAESCAPKAIRIEGGKALLDARACIRCYCCQEMCPVRAIRIRRISLRNF